MAIPGNKTIIDPIITESIFMGNIYLLIKIARIHVMKLHIKSEKKGSKLILVTLFFE